MNRHYFPHTTLICVCGVKRTVICRKKLLFYTISIVLGVKKGANYLIDGLQHTRNAQVAKSLPAKCGIIVAIRYVTQNCVLAKLLEVPLSRPIRDLVTNRKSSTENISSTIFLKGVCC
jgi:hypothetical protein